MINPFAKRQSVTINNYHQSKVITGHFKDCEIVDSTDCIIRWDQSLKIKYGKIQYRITDKSFWIDPEEYDVGSIILWQYELNYVVITDPDNYFRSLNFEYKLILWE